MINKQFNFLLVNIARNMRTLTKNKIKSTLSFEQIRTIAYIARYRGTSQKQLASLLESKPMAVSRTLEALERLNLIYRKTKIEDKRTHQIYLTPKGENTSKEIQLMSKDIFNIITQGIEEEQVNFFYEMMEKIQSNLTLHENDQTQYHIHIED